MSLIAEKRYLDVKKDYKTTVKQILEKSEQSYSFHDCLQNARRHYLENFKEYCGEDTRLANIRFVDIETYRNHLEEKLTKWDTLRKEFTVNREMSCLHHIFDKALEWEMSSYKQVSLFI